MLAWGNVALLARAEPRRQGDLLNAGSKQRHLGVLGLQGFGFTALSLRETAFGGLGVQPVEFLGVFGFRDQDLGVSSLDKLVQFKVYA